MSKCANCGTDLREGALFCFECGTPVENTASDDLEPIEVSNPEQDCCPDHDSTEAAEVRPITVEEEKEEDNTFGVLAYLGPLVFIPLFAKPKSKFMQFHARQGLTLLVLEVATSIISALLLLIRVHSTETMFGVPYDITITPWWTRYLVYIISAASVILSLIGVIRVETKQMKALPIIGKFDIISLFDKKNQPAK